MTAASDIAQCSRRRGGYLLAEAVVMLVLSMLVGAVMCAALISQARLARAIAGRIAQNDAVRATLHILPVELRPLDPVRDVRAISGDSVAARWIRGSGTVCRTGGDYMWVRIRGMRLIDPSKDSLIVTGAHGEHAVTLDGASADAAACPTTPGEAVYRVRTPDPDLRDGAAVLFESGTYYLAQRALRYRIGAEGRQPLTDELLRDAGTAVIMTAASMTAPAVVTVTLELRPALQHPATRSATVATPFANSRGPL